MRSRSRFRFQTKHVIIIAVIFLAAIGYGVYRGTTSEFVMGSADVFKAVPVAFRDVDNIIYTSGRIRAKNAKFVLAKTNGVVANINVKAGETVVKDQVIASLASENLLEQIDQKQLALQIDKNNFLNAREMAERQLKEAEIYYEEKKELYNVKVISKSELEMARQEYQDAKKETTIDTHDAIPTELETKYLKYKQSELILESLYKDLEATTIKSPMEGIITAIYIKDSDSVSTDNKLFEIVVLDELEVHASVGQYDINKVKIGMEVTITGDAFEHDYQGKVVNIAASAVDQGTGSIVEVIIDVEDESSELKHNFKTNANILVSSVSNVLTVPVDAVGVNLNDETVIQIREWKESEKGYEFTTIPVVTGIRNDLYIEILSEEVQEGDLVVAIYRAELDPKGRIN